MKHWLYRLTVESLIFNLWAFAPIGSMLFFFGLAEWGGLLEQNSSLNMYGKPVESNAQYREFIIGTGIISCIGWLFIFLNLTGRLVIPRSHRIFLYPDKSHTN